VEAAGAVADGEGDDDRDQGAGGCPGIFQSPLSPASKVTDASYDLAMPKRQVESFDPRERAAAKQAARDADARALRDGEISVAQLHRKNGLLAFPKEHLSVDFAGFLERAR
jgi:hypothetical protein